MPPVLFGKAARPAKIALIDDFPALDIALNERTVGTRPTAFR